jgi:NADP-dependent 3-hydroxy acid dehydrogenase YdfG
MKDLAKRTAIITGASRGLGAYVARAFAAEEMNMVLAARSKDGLERVAEELRRSGVEAVTVPTDVTDRKALEALVAAADAEFGGADVLVNNAGALTVFPYDRIGIEDIELAVRLNLTSAMILTRLVLPGMVERGRGHIVNMSSLAGIWGPPFDAPYGATKAGLRRECITTPNKPPGSRLRRSRDVPRRTPWLTRWSRRSRRIDSKSSSIRHRSDRWPLSRHSAHGSASGYCAAPTATPHS